MSKQILQEELDSLHNATRVSRYIWNQYIKLFAVDDEQMAMLNNTAPQFFFLVKETFQAEVYQMIRRLTDPADMGPNENLSFERILATLKSKVHSRVFAQLRLKYDDIAQRSEPIRI